jgi:hypothetical protein
MKKVLTEEQREAERQRKAAYYQAHKEERRLRDAEYRRAHREALRLYFLRHYATHKEERLAAHKAAYAERNKERIQARAASRPTPEQRLERRRQSKARYRATHKETIRASSKRYHTENKDKIRESGRQYSRTHKERIKQYNIDNAAALAATKHKYYLSRKEELKAYTRAYNATPENRAKRAARRREYERNRMAEDPSYKLSKQVRLRTRSALRQQGAKKLHHTFALLGCSLPELRSHLERQFSSGMSWDNFGTFWSLDHCTPCACYLLADPVEARQCFHYTNLQPMLVKDNLLKGSCVGGVRYAKGLPVL